MGDGVGLAVGLLVGLFVGGLIVGLFLRAPRRGPEQSPRAASAPAAPPPAADGSLAAFADGLGVGVLWLDRAHVVSQANEGAHRLLDRQSPSLVGLSALAVFLDHRVDDLLGQARTARAELELTSVGEPQRTLLLAAEPRPGGWLVILRDVSELRRLQRIRSEFIDNLAHELRTPLTTIRLLTETLRDSAERAELPAKMRERIATVDVETGHLVQMVNELLDLSRIEAGASRLQLATIDVGSVIENAVDRLRTFAERQQVRLAVEHEPESHGELSVAADEERLGQVLVNLLHNAIKFSPAGGTVSVSTRVTPAEVLVAVRDEGSGIPRADLDRVFERFYKADRARSRGPGGTGLGLAIARHIIEGHGGRIWVESEEGRGATFTFSLPR